MSEKLSEMAEVLRPIDMLSKEEKELLKELGVLDSFFFSDIKKSFKNLDKYALSMIFKYTSNQKSFNEIIDLDYRISIPEDVNQCFIKFVINENTPIKYIRDFLDYFHMNGLGINYGIDIDDEVEINKIQINVLMFKYDHKSFNYSTDINHRVAVKLNDYNLWHIVNKYMKLEGLINVDFDDFKVFIDNHDIINYFYGNIDVSNDIEFNFIPNEDANVIVLITGNLSLRKADIEKIISAVEKKVTNANMLQGIYIDDKLSNNMVNVLVINTK